MCVCTFQLHVELRAHYVSSHGARIDKWQRGMMRQGGIVSHPLLDSVTAASQAWGREACRGVFKKTSHGERDWGLGEDHTVESGPYEA